MNSRGGGQERTTTGYNGRQYQLDALYTIWERIVVQVHGVQRHNDVRHNPPTSSGEDDREEHRPQEELDDEGWRWLGTIFLLCQQAWGVDYDDKPMVMFDGIRERSSEYNA